MTTGGVSRSPTAKNPFLSMLSVVYKFCRVYFLLIADSNFGLAVAAGSGGRQAGGTGSIAATFDYPVTAFGADGILFFAGISYVNIA